MCIYAHNIGGHVVLCILVANHAWNHCQLDTSSYKGKFFQQNKKYHMKYYDIMQDYMQDLKKSLGMLACICFKLKKYYDRSMYKKVRYIIWWRYDKRKKSDNKKFYGIINEMKKMRFSSCSCTNFASETYLDLRLHTIHSIDEKIIIFACLYICISFKKQVKGQWLGFWLVM